MRLCYLEDCEMNKNGYCSDGYSSVLTHTVRRQTDCQSYNPVYEEDDSGAPFWD